MRFATSVQEDVRVDPWQPEGDHEGESIAELTLTGPRAPGIRFVDCELRSVSLTDGDLDGSVWRTGRIANARWVGVSLRRSAWHHVVVETSALSGCDLSGSRFQGVRFVGVNLDAVNLRGSTLRDCEFVDCRLRDVELGAAAVTRTRFPGCTVQRLELREATLQDVDLRGATLDVAHGVDRLRGASVDPGQLIELAPALAAHLGLVVRAPGE
jgi:uncharacterized protein YjbI with pentapeptide repeats